MFYVIGGSNIDIYCKSDKELILKDSNPCKLSYSFGGVARNVVENLSNLHERICFISAFGNDHFGEAIKNDLIKRNVDLSYCLTVDGYSTSTYIAILNENDMFVGVNDMSVLNKLDKKHLSVLCDVVKDDDLLFLDTNLDRELIEYILKNIKGIKVCDAISANKVIKLDGLTKYLNCLKLNELEAKTLSKKDLSTKEEIVAYIKSLINDGLKEVLITGKDYLYIGNNEQIVKYKHNAYRQKPVNVSGAGDALISYYMAMRYKGKSIEDAARIGITASVLTVDENKSVKDMDLNFVLEKSKEIIIEKEN